MIFDVRRSSAFWALCWVCCFSVCNPPTAGHLMWLIHMSLLEGADLRLQACNVKLIKGNESSSFMQVCHVPSPLKLTIDTPLVQKLTRACTGEVLSPRDHVPLRGLRRSPVRHLDSRRQAIQGAPVKVLLATQLLLQSTSLPEHRLPSHPLLLLLVIQHSSCGNVIVLISHQ